MKSICIWEWCSVYKIWKGTKCSKVYYIIHCVYYICIKINILNCYVLCTYVYQVILALAVINALINVQLQYIINYLCINANTVID